jgi:hypothetical protein
MSDPLSAEVPGYARDFLDASWFPVDLHVPDRRYGFLSLDEHVLLHSSFLDTRIDAPLDAAQPVEVAEIPPVLPQAPLSWLFHTSFCGSTLAARALHLPPYTVCLREPLVLRRLGDARHSGWPLEGLVDPTLRLLARPWQAGGAVVIKPTHAALNIAKDLMAATPTSRAVVLTSSLDDFLVSNLKKTPESQAKIPALAERALRAGTIASRFPAAALQPPDLLAAAALQWVAQRELVLDVIESVGGDRVRVANLDWLLADLPGAMTQIAHWLRLAIPAEALHRQCAAVSARNAKAIESPYGPHQRAREVAMVSDLYREPLARARAWAEQHLLPAMRPQARHEPQPWIST